MQSTETHHPHSNQNTGERLGLETFFGMSEYEVRDGKTFCRFKIEERHANLMGNMNGGVIYAASDMVGYNALLAVLPHDKGAVTADIQVSMLRGGRVGDTVEMVAQVIKVGRTLAFIEVESFIAGKLIATTKLTKAVLDI